MEVYIAGAMADVGSALISIVEYVARSRNSHACRYDRKSGGKKRKVQPHLDLLIQTVSLTM